MIFLFTDFCTNDLYVGQMHARIRQICPDVAIIDLLHEVPNFDVMAGAHLLAALHAEIPAGSVVIAVVDPGVGSERRPVAAEIDGRWYVGPDNGLLSVAGARGDQVRYQAVDWRPQTLSNTFHGRDLFAPVGAMLSQGMQASVLGAAVPAVQLPADDHAAVIYIDHYGNAMTGWRVGHAEPDWRLQIGEYQLSYANYFSQVPAGTPFWYGNAMGLVEVAVNGGSAEQAMAIKPGQSIAWIRD
jgi:S-adenosylmethionine hydrolase